jgi:myo-inositol-1(or 4)-monophosphatase
MNDRLKAAFEAADRGREILIKYFGHLTRISHKERAGLVSEADVESEKAIAAVLKKHFPQSRFLGEESGLDQKPSPTELLWIVDPLDGTTNYVHQLPFFCISIGLKIGDELELGVVDVPMMDTRYYALKNQGAFMNNKRIKVSDRAKMTDSLLATGFNVHASNDLKKQLEIFSHFIFKTRGIRRAGAAAYDLCLVAQGSFDGFWEKNLSPWDTAAGTLLVREAGGIVTNYAGEQYDPSMDDIIAGSDQIQPQVLEIVKKYY